MLKNRNFEDQHAGDTEDASHISGTRQNNLSRIYAREAIGSFVSSIVASLYKIRKVRAKKLLNRLDTLIILISSKRRTLGLWVSGDRRQNYPGDGREGALSAAWYTAAREKGNGTFNLANGDMIHNDIGDPHAEVIILWHIFNLISQWLDIGEYIAQELFSWSVSIWASFLLRSDHKVFLTLPPKKLAFPGKVFQPLWPKPHDVGWAV